MKVRTWLPRLSFVASWVGFASVVAACGGGEATTVPDAPGTGGEGAATSSVTSTSSDATGSTTGTTSAGTGGDAGTGGGADTGGAGGAGGDVPDDEDPGDPDDGGPGDPLEPEEPMPEPEPDPGEPEPPGESIVTVATWNANYNNTVPTVVKHIKTIDADVLGLQEMGSKDHAGKIIAGVTCASCDYAAYHPQKDNAHACPIIWKKAKFKRLDAGSFKVNDAKFIKDGGSRQNLLAKSTVWVKLEDKKTGAKFFLSNNHLVPSVEKDGKPFPGREERLAMFDRHMDGIVETVKKAHGQKLPIFVTGDFNVNYRKDRQEQAPRFPYARFKAQNVFANWFFLGAPAGGTHHDGNRLIDYVHATKTPKVEMLSQAILAPGGSDHKPVRVKVRLKP